MTQHIQIRRATVQDLSAMLHIYAPVVRDTAISFEYAVPPLEEFTARFAGITTVYPWLACEVDGSLAGYAYAHAPFAREAYQWTTELSTYVSPEYRRQGVGTRLMRALENLLILQGFHKLYALVAALNLPSIRLMEREGFVCEGHLRNVGYKLAQWHDVLWLGKEIRPAADNPTAPVPLPHLPPGMVADVLQGYGES